MEIARKPDRRTVFVAEDDPALASIVRTLLVMNGYDVEGPHASVRAALSALDDSQPDLALLDFELRDGDSCPIARELEARDIPFIVVTGNACDCLPELMRRHCVLRKPVGSSDLLGEIDACEIP